MILILGASVWLLTHIPGTENRSVPTWIRESLEDLSTVRESHGLVMAVVQPSHGCGKSYREWKPFETESPLRVYCT